MSVELLNKNMAVELLNKQQRKALNCIKIGFNIFLTGPAGVGKSFTINTIIKEVNKKTYITATTGIAATNIGGTTVHSWAGTGIPKPNVSAASLVKRIRRNNSGAYKRWMDAELLIIDEVSMLDYTYLTLLEEIGRIIRRNNNIFGGIQILLCGDFGQLSPIQRDRDEPKYLFEDIIWNKIVEKNILLHKVYRQDHKEFVDMLMRIRDGTFTDEDVKRIKNTRNNNLSNEWNIVPTTLFCLRKDVDTMNQKELDKLPTPHTTFKSTDYYENEEEEDIYKKNWRYPPQLNLKVGAQVMLLTNGYYENHGLVNGSRGIVTEIKSNAVQVQFMNGANVDIMQEKIEITDEDELVKASRKQYPLTLAWSMSIHKAQGQTIELLDVDIGKAFAYGQAYVALSRGVNLNKMIIRNFSEKTIKTNKKVKDFYSSIKEDEDNKLTVNAKRQKN